ncbi:NADPH-dependent FMN reductase [Streptomyces sp. W4I9-2]|uniref:NADPH-dependent FMN reductase n=1 Tax=Streptomyces sp. W4I9-2 TaxID=3042297 RepID=UPI00278B60D3|nr:NAD(P)H-dependent oxidoreductase [Streptomyces sp. W4I9-2]MDQ0700922.1 NAD(P)H-dependent FMN reductase [Streptomyces sp. W4I9-2]
MTDLAPWLDRADAFVIVTPEYNHTFPASLKNAIDWYVDAWKAKPVAFFSYGGMAGGLRAVADLRGIFPGLHSVTVRDSVCFPNYTGALRRRGPARGPRGLCNGGQDHGRPTRLVGPRSERRPRPAAVSGLGRVRS